MKRHKFIAGIIASISICYGFAACGTDEEPPNDSRITLNKMRGDYSRNVFGILEEGKFSSFKYHYCGDDTIWPIALENGYYLDIGLGSTQYENSVPTKIKISDFTCCSEAECQSEKFLQAQESYNSATIDSLLDTDPFLEFYVGNARDFEGGPEGILRAIDTAKINRLIREGKLEKYFSKKK